MTRLSERSCRNGAELLAADELTKLLAELEGWEIAEGLRLTRRYAFADFKSALAFVNRLGEVAERENHHPDLELGWGRVSVALTTHDAGGLTENDFIVAAKIDAAL